MYTTGHLRRDVVGKGVHACIRWVSASGIRSPAFYDEHAKKRQYFYHVDLLGRLFLEDAVPKNVTTCLKSEKFLNFFFSRLRANNTGLHEEYPLVSPCGREMNFIKAEDTGIVFTHVSQAHALEY